MKSIIKFLKDGREAAGVSPGTRGGDTGARSTGKHTILDTGTTDKGAKKINQELASKIVEEAKSHLTGKYPGVDIKYHGDVKNLPLPYGGTAGAGGFKQFQHFSVGMPQTEAAPSLQQAAKFLAAKVARHGGNVRAHIDHKAKTAHIYNAGE